uniref:EB domain-containing protein n=1 Tax=Romanomermis culicivorax TaxID=13658 RepID=A0A915K596_ROMCU
MQILILVLHMLFTLTKTTFFPDHGFMGDSCDFNDDCSGYGVVCIKGKLPDRINYSCSDACKLPMFCNNGKCDCIRSIVVNDVCFAESSFGQSCTKNEECVQPFSACISGSCRCIAGAVQVGSTCQAAPHCPTGAQPSGFCSRNSTNKQNIQNYANSGSQIDNCTKDAYCYTEENSYSGVCCPAVCPLSQKVDTRFTCDPNQVTVDRPLCPDDTHYCHRAAECKFIISYGFYIAQSYSSTVCCPKPCYEPTPLFIRGACYARAFLNGPCEIDEQCDGAYGMQCTNKRCQCRQNFKPDVRNATNVDDDPAQICVRNCDVGQGAAVEHQGECFAGQLSVGDSCVVDDQCPQGGRCFRGVCRCLCDRGYFPANNNRTCATVESRTVKPSILQPVSGSTPTTFINLIKSIFGANAG